MILDWLAQYRINEYSDLLGLLITVVGFCFTIWQISRSRKVTDAARAAAEVAREEVKRMGRVGTMRDVLRELEDMKPLLRQGSWDVLAGRCAKVRRTLIDIRASSKNLSDTHQSYLQEAVSMLQTFENKYHQWCGAERPHDFSRMMIKMIKTVDQLSEALNAMRQDTER